MFCSGERIWRLGVNLGCSECGLEIREGNYSGDAGGRRFRDLRWDFIL